MHCHRFIQIQALEKKTPLKTTICALNTCKYVYLYMPVCVYMCWCVLSCFCVFCIIKSAWNIAGLDYLCLRSCLCWHVWDSSGSVTGEVSTWPLWAHLLPGWQVTQKGLTVAIGNRRTSERVFSEGNLEDHGWALRSSGLASAGTCGLARKETHN